MPKFSSPPTELAEFINKEEAMDTMRFVEWVCKITVVYGFVALVLLLFVRHLKWQIRTIRDERRAARAREEADTQRRKVLDHQENLGNQFFNALSRAVAENPNLGRHGGIGRDKENSQFGYSVVVWRWNVIYPKREISEVGTLRIVRVDINLLKPAGQQIHVFRGPHGPDTYYPVGEAETVLKQLVELVRNYVPALA